VTPEALGHYRLEDQIGEGGMGKVYRAFDTRLKRHVAVKIWRHAGLSSVPSSRLLREARAASALNHPNIVVIHEVGETPDGDQYMVQEFIEGRTLHALASERLPMDRLLDIGAQVARALATAHVAGIVHRDIKPENVMVRADGLAKVLDFGIAVITRPATSTGTLTTLETGTFGLMGTPAYVSPEQAHGETVGPPSDIFSLGIVLYELATGARPFVGPTTLSIIASIATQEAVPLSRMVPDIPPRLNDLVQTMLDKNPDRRPTAEEVVASLALCIAGLGTQGSRIAARQSITVGREAQLGQLLAAHQRVVGGRSVMIGVSGEPGIGKSSLLEEFLSEVVGSAERPIIARARCSENLAGAEAYLPVLEALDTLRGPGGLASFEVLLRSTAPTWASRMLSLAATAPEDRQAASQERMKRELAALLQDVSRRAPLIWVIDDLHWADVSTIDILNYLTGHFSDMRVLVVVCFRPTDMALAKHPFLAIKGDLRSKGLYEEISLGFLTRSDVAQYLELEFPGNRFPEAFIAAVHGRTEGSPLFMVDLVRYLRDTGALVEENGEWQVAKSLPNAPSELPDSVRGMIERKIERVDDLDRKLLLAACVQGQEFDATLVGEALEMDLADVEERLDALERVHVLVVKGQEHEYPDRGLTMRYRFVHVLYQNVLYASLQPTRRAAHAGRTARALAAHHGNDVAAVAARLAVLFETAREFASAAQYFYLAAQRAVALFGFSEALSLAERGLAGLSGLPDTAQRQQLELGLQMVRGLGLRSVKGWAAPELEPTFARARQLCQQMDDPPALFPVLWNLAFFNMIRGNLALVREQLITLYHQAEATPEAAFMMSANHVDGVTSEFMGDVVRSTELLEQARVLHDPARHEEYNAMFGIDPGMVARAMSSRPLWALGYADQALARGRETIALGRSQRQPVTLVFALIVCEGIHLYRGEAREAIALGDEIIGLCREYEFPQEAEWARAFQGAAMAQSGQVDEGVAQLRASLTALNGLRAGLVRTMFLSLLAEALWRADRFDESLGVLEEGFAHADRTLEFGFLHELNRVKGEVFRRTNRLDEAEACFKVAIEHAKGHSAKAFELRATTAMARLLSETGRSAEARAMLAPLLDWFSEGLDTADLVSARTLLTQLK
jgi:tRNA A-37 threonylcarbamoyl transferase component Bud32/tetratricopeptide (TPR) repeat protein